MKKLIGILLFALAGNAYAAVSNDKSTFGQFDILQWQVRESAEENWAQVIPPDGAQKPIQLIDAPFNWNTGFRVGIGNAFNQDDDALFTYTHYQTTASNQASGIVYSAFLGNYFINNTNGANFGPSYNSANILWKFFYNSLDLNLGRNFKFDSPLQLHPYIGLKAASINQTIYTHWLNPTIATTFTTAREDLKNNFWGVGPSTGINSKWPIYSGAHRSFNFIGNVTLGLLWGRWNFNEIYTNDTPTTVAVNVSSVMGASPMVGGFLGLQWMSQFARSDLIVRIGYEAQIWFNQLQFYSYNMGRLNQPISLQGGNLEFQLNF